MGDDSIKYLIEQLENIPDMPNEIICKYWIKAYTFETDFYKVIKHKLQIKKGKLFSPYIKMMYEGLKNEVFKPKYEQPLYRGTVISNSELQKLDNLLNEQKNNNVPKAIIYFRSFQSYTINKNIALSFMNSPKNIVDNIKVLFIVEPISNNLQIDISNALKIFQLTQKKKRFYFSHIQVLL